MTLQDIRARVQRPDALARGLAKETVLVEECDDPLLYRERQDSLQALREALVGGEDAHIVLVKARRRLESFQSGDSTVQRVRANTFRTVSCQYLPNSRRATILLKLIRDEVVP
jgi:hypothetical protein